MKRGEQHIIRIDKFVFEGFGLGVLSPEHQEVPEGMENFKFFVRFAYPGDIVRTEVTKVKKNYAEAEVREIITASPHRTEALCPYFTRCGGCKQQDLDYAQQVVFKEQQVEELFQPLRATHEFSSEPVLPSERIFRYRNKMEFSFSEVRWLPLERLATNPEEKEQLTLGFHPPRGFNNVMQIDECWLQPETGNTILQFAWDFFAKRKATVYNSKTESGFLRNLVIRQAAVTGEIMVNLVTSSRDENLMREFTEGVLAAVPSITTVINNINTRKAMVATGEFEFHDHGNGYIIDSIGKPHFRISANSFFQTNTIQAEHLYQTALDFAGFTGNEIVYDLYCGAGSISLFINNAVKAVYGLELVESAVNDANENKKLNAAENVHFFASDLYKSFIPLTEAHSLPPPDVIIVDPPRNGMHKNTIDDILAILPPKIVYVSCNPATQVRDIQLLEGAYNLVKIKPVDMFPHTYHIENVALLVKK